MKKVTVNLGQRSYDILIDHDLLRRAGQVLREKSIGSRVFLIANTTVHELYGENLKDHLEKEGFEVVNLLIPDGEPCKNFQTVENIYTYLIAQRADRQSTLIALGGGVTGDIVGFVAATFLRGVPYLQIPTTLLAQVDSSVGGKTGVNHRLGKNLIGAFYQPSLVFVDTQSLNTLQDREFQAGLYEVIKYGLIYDREFYDYFCENLGAIKDRDPLALADIISRCCEIKAEITSIDEKEESLRRILNFGHTLGHALEAATSYGEFKHGEAVAYGMIAATYLSHHQGYLDAAVCEQIRESILAIGPLPRANQVPFKSLLDSIKHDKKRQDDKIFFVLLKDIGKTVVEAGFEEELLAQMWKQAVTVSA